jgi:hypothetical protein
MVAFPGAPALGPYEVALIAVMDKTLLTNDERAQLVAWRKRTGDAHVIARIDFLLAP